MRVGPLRIPDDGGGGGNTIALIYKGPLARVG